MAEIVGGIGWILALVFGYLAMEWRMSSNRLRVDRDRWHENFQEENKRASGLYKDWKRSDAELNALKEAIRERAKQPVVPVQRERSIRKGSWADIRKANQAAILREQEISDKKDADTAFEE